MSDVYKTNMIVFI